MMPMKINEGGKNIWVVDATIGCNGNNGGFLDNLLGGNGNTEILLFLVVFLLLFTSFGRQNNTNTFFS